MNMLVVMKPWFCTWRGCKPLSYNPLEYFLSLLRQKIAVLQIFISFAVAKSGSVGKERGFEFSTTLTISPYQDLSAIWSRETN